MKTIVTHLSPDIDAIASVWLIHRFLPGWEEAHVELVTPGMTLHDMPPDRDSNILHVDTGGGQFDHHHTSDCTSAARLIFDHLCAEGHMKDSDIPALERIVDVITRYDHFQEVYLEDADDDMHVFSLAYVILGLRPNSAYGQRMIEFSEEALDGILQYMKGKLHAEELIERGYTYTTYWGKTLVIETDNDSAMRAAFMKGFDMVIRFSPHYKNVAIKVNPRVKRTLKKLQKPLIKQDPDAFWFYHASGRVMLNAARKEMRHRVTKYSLNEIVEIVKGI